MHRFRVELDDGEALRAERIVATRITPLGWRPLQFAGLPPALVSHTSDHSDLGVFKSRRVAFVGGGQSAFESAALLAESGAEDEILARGHTIHWLQSVDSSWTDPRLRYYARGKISMGSPRSAGLAAWPGLVRWLPDWLHESLNNRCRRLAVAARLKLQLSKVPITTGRSVVSASLLGDKIVLELDDGRSIISFWRQGTAWITHTSHFSTSNCSVGCV